MVVSPLHPGCRASCTVLIGSTGSQVEATQLRDFMSLLQLKLYLVFFMSLLVVSVGQQEDRSTSE